MELLLLANKGAGGTIFGFSYRPGTCRAKPRYRLSSFGGPKTSSLGPRDLFEPEALCLENAVRPSQ